MVKSKIVKYSNTLQNIGFLFHLLFQYIASRVRWILFGIKYFAATLFVFNQINVINRKLFLNYLKIKIIGTVIVYILSRTIQLSYAHVCILCLPNHNIYYIIINN